MRCQLSCSLDEEILHISGSLIPVNTGSIRWLEKHSRDESQARRYLLRFPELILLPVIRNRKLYVLYSHDLVFVNDNNAVVVQTRTEKGRDNGNSRS